MFTNIFTVTLIYTRFKSKIIVCSLCTYPLLLWSPIVLILIWFAEYNTGTFCTFVQTDETRPPSHIKHTRVFIMYWYQSILLLKYTLVDKYTKIGIPIKYLHTHTHTHRYTMYLMRMYIKFRQRITEVTQYVCVLCLCSIRSIKEYTQE